MPDIEKLIAAFEDPGVIELMINDDAAVFVEVSGGRLQRIDARPTPQDVLAFVRGVVGAPEEFGPRRPYADLMATDGSRIHVLAPPLVKGMTVTVRKRPMQRPTLRQLVEIGGGSNRDIFAQAGQSFPRPTRQRNSRPITLANTL